MTVKNTMSKCSECGGDVELFGYASVCTKCGDEWIDSDTLTEILERSGWIVDFDIPDKKEPEER